MDENIIPWIILGVICFVVLGALTLFELRMRKKREAASGFVIGRIYQMEDGSLAKYVGDGKFIKVKTEAKSEKNKVN